MAPLIVNEIISPDTNLLLALLIGIGFGFVLESSGFSSSRKMVGVFYGYDTTVLKVFFTGAITAIMGILFLSLFGLVQMDYLYIHPTYMTSAILGGVVMGGGFLLGGYCPGTAFSAIAIGKIDGMLFMVGMFIGVFLFAEGYPLWEGVYKANFMGTTTMNEILDIPRGVFALGLILIALAMFWVGEWAEKKFPREEY
ncbi:sulfurtransferase [Labilibaculum filiforme]|uniref:Sulfurtransferase n=1 Tax=Labilibaculum filiforme TaxID=1940526 RepID=A0A2N3HW16_9BACT|nr:YeeE/YedE thiosulfate transporter family protein [Labilibaculum filiforme]PKQ62254.1 sulfurtransferase [Labilibaculum filiforme]